MHDTRLPLFTAKNKSFGFSMYSISVSAATSSTICSGKSRIAYSFRRFVILIRSYSSGNFSANSPLNASSVPPNFTITSQVRSALSYPVSRSNDFSLSRSVASSARFNRFSIFSLDIKIPRKRTPYLLEMQLGGIL